MKIMNLKKFCAIPFICNKAHFYSFSNLDKTDDNILSSYTNSLYKESRDKFGKLNFLSGNKRLEIIKECEIVDFQDNNGTLKKIKDLKIS